MTRRIAGLFAFAVLLSGCAVQYPEKGMYWDRYEETLYNLEHKADDRSMQRHFATLGRIVDVSNARGWRVPPGVYLELAMMEQQRGNERAYTEYINRERALYPESHLFIERWFADVQPPDQAESSEQ